MAINAVIVLNFLLAGVSMYLLARRIVGQREVLQGIHRAAGTYDSERPLHPWIFTIVANAVRTHLQLHAVLARFLQLRTFPFFKFSHTKLRIRRNWLTLVAPTSISRPNHCHWKVLLSLLVCFVGAKIHR